MPPRNGRLTLGFPPGGRGDGTSSPRIRPPSLARAAWLAPALALLGGAACRARSEPELRRYTLRGEVVRVPPAGAGRQVLVRHEALDDFVDASGAKTRMGAMTMPFDVAPDVPLAGIAPGDKVELRLAVGWSPPVMRVESIRKLPADTVLEVGPARPVRPRTPRAAYRERRRRRSRRISRAAT